MKEKPRGRPRLNADDTTTIVSVRVPTRDYDRACARERREGTTVADLVRRSFARVVGRDDEGD